MTRDIYDIVVQDMSEKLCELLGVPCTPEVLAHWNTHEGQEILRALRPQLQLLGARALQLAATPQPPLKLKPRDTVPEPVRRISEAPDAWPTERAPSFLRAALKRVSPTARNDSPTSSGETP